MQNSTSIKNIVDVCLFSRLVTLFDYKQSTAEWLISASYENKEEWGSLGIREFAELLEMCTDKKQMRAAALFCWLYDFNNSHFISRLVGEIREEPDVIFEAAVYNSAYCEEGSDLWNVMNDLLRHTRWETSLEYMIALYALGDSVAAETKSCLCKLISAKMPNLDIEAEIPLFVHCAELAEELGSDSDIFMQAVLKGASCVPVERGNNYAALVGWGYDYVGQLKLSCLLQKRFKGKKMIAENHSKTEKLKECFLSSLCDLRRPWTNFESSFVQSAYVSGRYVVKCPANANSRMGVSLVFQIELPQIDDRDLAGVLLLSIAEYSVEGIRSVWKLNHGLFCRALGCDGPKSLELFCALKRADCKGLEVYTCYWEQWICDWQSVDSWNWVKEHGFSEMSAKNVDSIDYPFIKGKKEKSLFVSMLKEYLEVWEPHRYEELFEEEPNKFRILERWFTKEEIEEGMQYLPERVGVYTAAAIIRQPDIVDMIGSLCEDRCEEVERVFIHLEGRKVDAAFMGNFEGILDLDVDSSVMAAFVEKGICASDAEVLPQLLLDSDVIEKDPWVLDIDWSSDFNIDYWEWSRLTDAKKNFLKKFRGIVPLKYFSLKDEICKLSQKFPDRFEEIFDLVEIGVPISRLLEFDGDSDVAFGLFGEFRHCVVDGMPAHFVMWAKENNPELLRKIEGAKFYRNSLLFERNFYLHCDFEGVDVRQIALYSEHAKMGINYDKEVIDMAMNSSMDIAWLAKIAALSEDDIDVISQNESSVNNLSVLAFNLLQQNLTAWGKKFGVKGEQLIKVLSYNYRWDKESLGAMDYIINNEVMGALKQSAKYVFRKNYALRHVFLREDKSVDEVCVDRLIEVCSAKNFEAFAGNLYYGDGLLNEIGRHKLVRFLTGNLVLPMPGVDFMEGLDKKIQKFLSGRVGAVEAIDWAYQLKGIVSGASEATSEVAVWLNLIDGTWFVYKTSLYRILKDQDGYGVQCCIGEDVLDRRVRRIACTEVCITDAPCRIIVGKDAGAA